MACCHYGDSTSRAKRRQVTSLGADRCGAHYQTVLFQRFLIHWLQAIRRFTSAIRHVQRTMNREFQMIFLRQARAIDGDTAQVGPLKIAEELGMAQSYLCL